MEAVAPAGDHEVVVAVEAQLHRSAEPARRNGGDAREQRRLRLLAAEAAAHAPALDLHVVRLQAQALGDQVLHLARVLRRAVDEHAAVLARDRVRDLAFEIELLLAADLQRVDEAMRRGGDGGARVAARQMHRRQDVALGGVRLDRREDRRERLDRQRRLRLRRRAPRQVARLGDHREHRLADIVDEPVGEDRIVVDDRAAIVGAGDVGGDQHCDDAGQRRDALAIERDEAPVGDRRQAQRGVQCAGELGQVVDVGRGAGDVKVRRLVRKRRADGRRSPRRVVEAGRARRAQPLRIERSIHGVEAARGAGSPCAIALHTLDSAAASGASRRVSSQKRRSRFCATWSR